MSKWITILRRGAILLVTFVMAASTFQSVAIAAPPSTDHAVVCGWASVSTPTKAGSNLGGTAFVRCNFALDTANTRAELQIFESGAWRTYGSPVTSYDVGPEIRVYDGAPGRSGCWRYRLQGTHFGFHGNLFALATKYGGPVYLCF